MQAATLLCAVLALCALQLTAADLVRFESFKLHQNKAYNSDQLQAQDYNNFVHNLGEIDRLNAAQDGEEVFGETEFTDLSPEEFAQLYLSNLNTDDVSNGSLPIWDLTAEDAADSSAARDTRSTVVFNWCTKGYCTPVKNQGKCGSCWDFSAVAVAESMWSIAGHAMHILSTQAALDCTPWWDSCLGGLSSDVFKWIMDNGIPLDSAYPYHASKSHCRYNPATKPALVMWNGVVTNDKAQETTSRLWGHYLATQGPFVTFLDATPLQYYRGGIIRPSACRKNPTVNHAVVVVGFATGPVPYWIIRNSWGPSWGEHGFFRLQAGVNTCGIAPYSYAASSKPHPTTRPPTHPPTKPPTTHPASTRPATTHPATTKPRNVTVASAEALTQGEDSTALSHSAVSNAAPSPAPATNVIIIWNSSTLVLIAIGFLCVLVVLGLIAGMIFVYRRRMASHASAVAAASAEAGPDYVAMK